MKSMSLYLGICGIITVSVESRAQASPLPIEFSEIKEYAVNKDWETIVHGINYADGKLVKISMSIGDSPTAIQRTTCHDAIMKAMENKSKYRLILSFTSESIPSFFYVDSCGLKSIQ